MQVIQLYMCMHSAFNVLTNMADQNFGRVQESAENEISQFPM